jgi:tol-pal system protein YbgF
VGEIRMTPIRRTTIALFLAGAGLFAADKPSREIQELQRDVAQLQEAVKGLQRSLEDRISNLGTQVQGAADASGKAGLAFASVEKSVERVSRDQETKLAPAIGTLGGRIDQVSNGLNTVQQAVADLTSAVNQLQSQVGDLSSLVKIIQQPVTPPAPSGPPMPATELWHNAERDRTSGKYELAVQGYQDYLKWFTGGPQAANAQYYLGFSYYSLKDYENALKQFDAFVENYPKGAKTPEALFYSGKSLAELDRSSEAAEAYKKLRSRFPNHSLVRQIPR